MASSSSPWWVIVGTQYGSKPTYTYFQGTQADAQKRASMTVEVSSQKNLFGPYNTEQDAEDAVAGKGSQPVTEPTIPGGYSEYPGDLNLPNPFSSIEQALSTFYDALTNYRMWRSLGWLALGVFMIFAGMFLWLKQTVNPIDLAALAV